MAARSLTMIAAFAAYASSCASVTETQPLKTSISAGEERLVTHGNDEGAAWRLVVSRTSEVEFCLIMRSDEGGKGSSCGPVIERLFAIRQSIPKRLDATDVARVHFILGYVADPGMRVVVEGRDLARNELALIAVPGYRERFFIMHIARRTAALTVTAYGPAGVVIGRQQVPSRPSIGFP
jgi:hypothetical protein